MSLLRSIMVEKKNIEEIQNVLPIFHQAWWLETLAPGQWQYLSANIDGRLVAVWPLVVKSRFKFRIGEMAPFSEFLGPSLAVEKTELTNKMLEEIINQFQAQLRRFDFIKQKFPPGANYLDLLSSKGWKLDSRVTHQIHTADAEIDKIFSAFNSTRRRRVRQAERRFDISEVNDFDELLRFQKVTFSRRGISLPYKIDVLNKLVHNAINRKQGFVYGAKNRGTGDLFGTAFFIEDRRTLYYLLGGYSDNDNNGLAMSLLLWRGIKYAAQHQLVFDFEGSMIPGVAAFFKSFGGVPTKYFQGTLTNSSLLRILMKVRNR